MGRGTYPLHGAKKPDVNTKIIFEILTETSSVGITMPPSKQGSLSAAMTSCVVGAIHSWTVTFRSWMGTFFSSGGSSSKRATGSYSAKRYGDNTITRDGGRRGDPSRPRAVGYALAVPLDREKHRLMLAKGRNVPLEFALQQGDQLECRQPLVERVTN